ncbi:hypothetical protein Tco_0580968 [Tanacetum coccineum]
MSNILTQFRNGIDVFIKSSVESLYPIPYFDLFEDSFSSNDVEYVEASPPNSEPVSSKVMEIVIPEVGRIEDDILLIKDDTYLSLPDYKAFYIDNDHFKEKSSGSTTTHVDFSQYDSFIFDLSNDQFPPSIRIDFYHEVLADGTRSKSFSKTIGPSKQAASWEEATPLLILVSIARIVKTLSFVIFKVFRIISFIWESDILIL